MIKTYEAYWGQRVICALLLFVLSFLFVMLLTGSPQLKRNVPPNSSFATFMYHMNERIPELMKQYRIPGCSIA
jgi:hypothetical protein